MVRRRRFPVSGEAPRAAESEEGFVARESKLPEISPYVFPALLAGFGLWCLWDGWFTSDPAMQEHALFNRVASAVLLPWALWDYLRVRRREREEAASASQTPSPPSDRDGSSSSAP